LEKKLISPVNKVISKLFNKEYYYEI